MMNNFLREIMQAHPKATYGEVMVRNALEQGAVATLLISESLRKRNVDLQCNSCANEWTTSLGRMDETPPCPSCKSEDAKELAERDLIDEFTEMASRSSSSISFVSTDTEEGLQLHLGFGGLAAILRYPMG